MKLLIALLALIVAAPLAAQDAPEPKAESKTKVIKIENGKVVELEGEEAEKAVKEARERMKEMDERMREAREEMRKAQEEMRKHLEKALKDMGEDGEMLRRLLPAAPAENIDQALKDAMERARKAVDEALKKAGGGDVDIEHEEKSADGRTHVKIKIVRKTVKSEGSEGESPKETPETPKQNPQQSPKQEQDF